MTEENDAAFVARMKESIDVRRKDFSSFDFFRLPFYQVERLYRLASCALSPAGTEAVWQPMDTAPKDGTWIILDEKRECPIGADSLSRCRWDSKIKAFTTATGWCVRPNKWIPEPSDHPVPTHDEPTDAEVQAAYAAFGLAEREGTGGLKAALQSILASRLGGKP